MTGHGYKKYMKKEAQTENPLIKIFILSFFGMLLIMTFLIKSFAPTVDTSIGGDQDQQIEEEFDSKKIVDNRLEMIQNEDQGRNFKDLMANPDDVKTNDNTEKDNIKINNKNDENFAASSSQDITQKTQNTAQDTVYKVFVGSYTSAEQAKVAKDIIQESGNGLNPIVKCIGSNNYTLQVGIFKNKKSAESMLYTVQQNHLPGRIVEDY